MSRILDHTSILIQWYDVKINKGTLLSEVRVATVRMCKSNVMGVWVEGEMYHLWKYVYGIGKSWLRPCVSVFNLRMKVCSSINLSVLLESFKYNTFKVTDCVTRFVEVSGYW